MGDGGATTGVDIPTKVPVLNKNQSIKPWVNEASISLRDNTILLLVLLRKQQTVMTFVGTSNPNNSLQTVQENSALVPWRWWMKTETTLRGRSRKPKVKDA